MQHLASLVGGISPWLILLSVLICDLVIVVTAIKENRVWQGIRIIVSMLVIALAIVCYDYHPQTWPAGLCALYAIAGSIFGHEIAHAPTMNNHI